MKIKVDVDLTPEEARKLMGMPDLEPMQKAITKKIQDKMMQEIEHVTDPDYLFGKFLPLGLQSMEQMRSFINAMSFTDASGSETKKARK